MHTHTTQTKQVGVFPCRGLVAPCQRAPGSIKGLPLRCQTRRPGEQWRKVSLEATEVSISTCYSFATTLDSPSALASPHGAGNTLASAASLTREGWMSLGCLRWAIALSVWSTVAATTQMAVPAALPATLREPREGRAVRRSHLHQRASARRSRRAADAVRRSDTRHRRAGSRVSGHRRGRHSEAAASSIGCGRLLDGFTASSTTSAAAVPRRGWWRSFIGRRPPLDSSGVAMREAAWPPSTTSGTPCSSGTVKGPVTSW